MTDYLVGTIVRVSLTSQVAGVDTDPTTLTFSFKDPAGNITTYLYGTDLPLVKDATGKYHVDISMTQSGLYQYKWVGTGTAQDVSEGYFNVQQSMF